VASVALAGCDHAGDSPERVSSISADNTYTNNHYVRGAGYYHAPYHAWYPFPFNYHVPGRGYYSGGRWDTSPDDKALFASKPTPEAVSVARSQEVPARHPSGTRRGGFGSSPRFVTS